MTVSRISGTNTRPLKATKMRANEQREIEKKNSARISRPIVKFMARRRADSRGTDSPLFIFSGSLIRALSICLFAVLLYSVNLFVRRCVKRRLKRRTGWPRPRVLCIADAEEAGNVFSRLTYGNAALLN